MTPIIGTYKEVLQRYFAHLRHDATPEPQTQGIHEAPDDIDIIDYSPAVQIQSKRKMTNSAREGAPVK